MRCADWPSQVNKDNSPSCAHRPRCWATPQQRAALGRVCQARWNSTQTAAQRFPCLLCQILAAQPWSRADESQSTSSSLQLPAGSSECKGTSDGRRAGAQCNSLDRATGEAKSCRICESACANTHPSLCFEFWLDQGAGPRTHFLLSLLSLCASFHLSSLGRGHSFKTRLKTLHRLLCTQ
jgi:hypothetical protein